MTDTDPLKELLRLRALNIGLQLTVLLVVSFGLITLVHAFVAQPFVVWGDSMKPTFEPGEYLVIDEVHQRLYPTQRGEVVVFRYPLDPSIYFIKRVIGLPGDTVFVNQGHVYVQPTHSSTTLVLSEPYPLLAAGKKDIVTINLSEGEYFMIGDNRNASFDSRSWGPVPARYVVGRPLVRLYPFRQISVLPGVNALTLMPTTTPALSTGTRSKP